MKQQDSFRFVLISVAVFTFIIGFIICLVLAGQLNEHPRDGNMIIPVMLLVAFYHAAFGLTAIGLAIVLERIDELRFPSKLGNETPSVPTEKSASPPPPPPPLPSPSSPSAEPVAEASHSESEYGDGEMGGEMDDAVKALKEPPREPT